MYFVWEELHISKSTDFLKRQEVEVSQVVARQVKVLPPNEILVFLPNFTFFRQDGITLWGKKRTALFQLPILKKKKSTVIHLFSHFMFLTLVRGIKDRHRITENIQFIN